MNHYRDLSEEDRQQLLKFPAYISLLASTHENGIDQKEKRSVVKLTHIKTFSSVPLLADFYREAEKHFESTITELNDQLPKDSAKREKIIRQELAKLEVILSKLGEKYATALHVSLRAYTRHIAQTHHSLLEYFIFPVPIKGLSA
jgi:hypothetical protein